MLGLIDSASALEAELRRRLSLTGQSRELLAIVGAPASGKSTLASVLENRMSDRNAIVVPMDGFHLDNALLDQAGLRSVKGSPQTFDVAGLDSLLARIVDDRGEVLAPVFDRTADLARAAATRIDPSHRLIIVEGNYLLLNRPGWEDLSRYFDISVMIDVTEDELRDRLIQRWLDHGLDGKEAVRRAESNDLPNGRSVLQESAQPDLRYRAD